MSEWLDYDHWIKSFCCIQDSVLEDDMEQELRRKSQQRQQEPQVPVTSGLRQQFFFLTVSHQHPPGENILLADSCLLDAAQHWTSSKWLLSIWTSASYFILISLAFIQKTQTVSKSPNNKNL